MPVEIMTILLLLHRCAVKTLKMMMIMMIYVCIYSKRIKARTPRSTKRKKKIDLSYWPECQTKSSLIKTTQRRIIGPHRGDLRDPHSHLAGELTA